MFLNKKFANRQFSRVLCTDQSEDMQEVETLREGSLDKQDSVII